MIRSLPTFREISSRKTTTNLAKQAERARLQALATEFKNLLGEAVKSAAPASGAAHQATPPAVPEPKHFWLVPILHRLADIAERLEVRSGAVRWGLAFFETNELLRRRIAAFLACVYNANPGRGTHPTLTLNGGSVCLRHRSSAGRSKTKIIPTTQLVATVTTLLYR